MSQTDSGTAESGTPEEGEFVPDSSVAEVPEEATEAVAVDEENADVTEAFESEDLGSVEGDSAEHGPETDGSGVAEALEAWAAGGHAVDQAEDDDEVRAVDFAQLEEPAATKSKPRMSRLNNVSVLITVELGRKEMSVRELTDLKENDVVDLDKLAGEAFDILINERPFAEGEIVVVTDLMAVRITRLITRETPAEEEEE